MPAEAAYETSLLWHLTSIRRLYGGKQNICWQEATNAGLDALRQGQDIVMSHTSFAFLLHSFWFVATSARPY